MHRYPLIVASLLLAVLSLAACTRGPGGLSNSATNQGDTTTNTADAPTSNLVPTEAVTRTTRAVHFAERWGTYSTENNFINIEELLGMMTPRMREYAEQLISTGRRNPSQSTPVTTRSIVRTTVLESASATSAVYLLTMQRVETTGETERSYYQDLRLDMVNADGVWIVDQARWIPIVQGTAAR